MNTKSKQHPDPNTDIPDSYDMEAFGAWLRTQRIQRGLTKAQAAKALKIGHRTQSHREKGTKRCTQTPKQVLRAWDKAATRVPQYVTSALLQEAMQFTGLSMQGLSLALGKSRGAVGRYLRDDVAITITSQQLTEVIQKHLATNAAQDDEGGNYTWENSSGR